MSAPLLSLQQLSKDFGGIQALQNVSMNLNAGEIRCLIGPNGAGKSTLFNLIAGTFRPSIGKIFFEGTELAGQAPYEYARLGITRKFQRPRVFHSMTVQENLEVAFQGRKTAFRARNRLDEIFMLLDLVELADRKASALSHGQRQWLEIGMALIPEPKLLLLDEPTAGMTEDGTRKMVELLHRLEGRMAIFVIEHDMHFVRALQRDTLVMHQGQILRQGHFFDIERDPLVRDVYLGRQRF